MWWIFWLWAALEVFDVQHLQVFAQLLLAFIGMSGVLAAIFIPIRIRNDEKAEAARGLSDRRAATFQTLWAELQTVVSESRMVVDRIDQLEKKLVRPIKAEESPELEVLLMDIPEMPLLMNPSHWCVYLNGEQAKAVSNAISVLVEFKQSQRRVDRPDVARFLKGVMFELRARARRVIKAAEKAQGKIGPSM